VGKLPIAVPNDVEVNENGSQITVKGKFGVLEMKIPDAIAMLIKRENNVIINVSFKNEIRSLRAKAEKEK